MAQIKCKGCGNEVVSNAVLCSSCGSPQENKQSKVVRYGGGFLLLVAILAWLSSMLGSNANPTAPNGTTTDRIQPQAAFNAAPPIDEPILTKGEAAKALSAYMLDVQAKIFAQSYYQQISLSKLAQDIQWKNLEKFKEDAENLKSSAMDFQMKLGQAPRPDNLSDDDAAAFDAVEEKVSDFGVAIVSLAVDIAVYAHTGMNMNKEAEKDIAIAKKARRAIDPVVMAAYKHFGIPASKVNKDTLTLK